ncbi:hypothetical protein [Sporosarcina aquimarina]|uniref:Uncharacterized protein n=1 Tax=Sporosarcina aquimarina TaxID=114975 RepID=A0ABU4FW25_9BACL|nr:hypothetical protein [Sporosarcina aquimarina]MDW0108928.1 hypothetical protein [Sporosarcina aquimarina]
MHIPTLLWTAFVAAALSAISLKFLKTFHFVYWSPIGWTKKWNILEGDSPLLKWAVMVVMLFVLFLVLYMIMLFTTRIPPSVTSILVAVILVCATEWMISSPGSLGGAVKSISIPFLCIAAIITRFVTGTAVFMQKEFR